MNKHDLSRTRTLDLAPLNLVKGSFEFLTFEMLIFIYLVSQVEEEVFYHVNKQQLFKEMSQSRHFSKFVNYLISSDQLNNLLMQTIKSDRFDFVSFLRKLLTVKKLPQVIVTN